MSFDERACRPGDELPTGPTGRYRLDLTTQSWWWSDGMYALHGFRPGDVVPTTELVLAHLDPADRTQVVRFLAAARPTGEDFGVLHRIVDTDGRERSVAVVGTIEESAGTGGGLSVHGYATDVSSSVAERARRLADSQIEASARSRGVIEQAKGALAIVYRIPPESAFDVMRGASNDRNTPLREIAAAVLDAATGGASDGRARLDALVGPVPGTVRSHPGTEPTPVVTG